MFSSVLIFILLQAEQGGHSGEKDSRGRIEDRESLSLWKIKKLLPWKEVSFHSEEDIKVSRREGKG